MLQITAPFLLSMLLLLLLLLLLWLLFLLLMLDCLDRVLVLQLQLTVALL